MKKNFDTLYDTIRRISILMMLALSLMPIKGMGENLVYDDTNPSSSIQLDLQKYFNDWKYMVFYIEDTDGNKVKINDLTIISDGSQTLSYNQWNTDFNWMRYSVLEDCIRFNGGASQDWLKPFLNITIAPKSGIDINKYNVVVGFSNSDNILTDFGKAELSLNYQIYYLSSISSGGAPGSQAPDYFSLSTKKIINSDVSPTTASISLPRYGNPKYLRWQVYYNNTLQTTESWYNDGNTAASADLVKKITKSDDEDWNNYKVVCTWANDDKGAEIVEYDSKNYIINEPTLNGQYTWYFAAKTSSDRNITLHEPTGSEETINIPALLSGNDIILPLSDIYDKIQTAIGSSENFYIRIKLPEGNTIYDDASDKITSNNDNYQAYNSKYFLWNVTDDGNVASNIATLSRQALAVTLTNSSWTSGIQCAISASPASMENGVLKEEPASYNLVVNFNLKSESDLTLAKTTDLAGAITRKFDKVIDEYDTNATLEINKTKLIADLGGNSDNVYMRWMIKRGSDDVTSKTVIANDQWRQTNGSDQYWYSVASSDALTDGVCSLTFTPESGYTFADYTIQLLIANNLKGMETLGDFVTKEPSAFSYIYQYAFYTPSTVPFVHYEGIANAPGDYNRNGTQKVHEYTYYYYVKGNEKIELTLPLDQYTTNSGNVLEPRGWFRWYNWESDKKSPYISPYDGTNTKLKLLPGDKGLCAFKLDDSPTQQRIGVYYTPPSDAEDINWEDEVACDVSRYCDGISDDGSYMKHEPTLGIRYRYVIRSYKWIAKQLEDYLVANTDMETFEDQKTVSLGVSDTSEGSFTLRLNYNNVSSYYFHPLTESGKKKHVYCKEEQAAENRFQASDFDESRTINATGTMWYIYNSDKSKYAEASGDGQKYEVRLDKLSTQLYFKELNSTGGSSENIKFDKGSKGYIVVYLTHGTDMCPVANMEFEIQNSAPMKFEDLATKAPERTIENIESKYSQSIDPISFDNINRDQTLTKATEDNNLSSVPGKWDRRQYSHVYKDLWQYTHSQHQYPGAFSAIHGDYGIYKSANVNEVSKNGMTKVNGKGETIGLYTWYNEETGDFYDRTHAMTNGTQTGYFLYVDASEESRPIASADFEADLCSGSSIVVSAAVASITTATTKPQLMFKLYGVDDNGNISQETLLHSFASGDFAKVTGFAEGKWMQVYANVTLANNSGVGNYSRFRLVIDNYCPNTQGADYAIDDIRIYQRVSSVETIVDQSLCDDGNVAGGGEATLTIRAKYESLQAKASPFDSDSKTLYFRIIGEDGKVVEYDFNNDGKLEQYGLFTLPKTAPADISSDPNFIKVNEDVYFIIAKGSFGLKAGKKYYISMSFEDPSDSGFDPSAWGNPMDACSVYSEWFTMEKQQIVVKDAIGKVLTSIGMPCEGTPNYEIRGELQVADPVNGGTMNLSGLKLDWYLGTKSEFNSVVNLKQAWDAFRQEYPDVIAKQVAKGNFTDEYKEVLDKEIDEKRLFLAATDKIDYRANIPFSIHSGLTYMCALVITDNGSINEVTVGENKYTVCPEPMEFSFRVIKDGPKVNLGFNKETYPSDPTYRSVRLGLRHLKEGQVIELPLHSTELIPSSHGEDTKYCIKFDNNEGSETNKPIFISDTNDPKMDLSTTKILFTIEDPEIKHLAKEDTTTQRTLKVEATPVAQELHEGYWYELNFDYKQYNVDEGYNSTCPGTTYFRILVVPEFLTWTPTADGAMSNNWNNDLNWRRSTQETLYKNDYQKYDGSAYPATQQSYIPMKFSKVTMETPANTPGSYPYLNYIKTSSTGLATSLSNKMYPATKDVEYDIMVKVKENPESPGNYGCERFYGNTCSEIYFKPEGELRNQQYLEYQKAWVEKEMDIDKWYILGSPLKDVVAGDMYMPKNNGRQETEAFNDIKFDPTYYSRTAYPVYQRTWDTNAPREITSDREYSAWHQPEATTPSEISFSSLLWSHVYNDVTERYDNAGFSIKVGDAYYPSTNRDAKVLIRLPKADRQYTYYNPNGTTEGKSETIGERLSDNNLQIEKDLMEDASGATRMPLTDNDQHQSDFVMLYNPYMSTLDIKKFINANANSIDGSEFWTMKASETESGNVNVMEKVTEGYIAPMQAFFVKKRQGAGQVNFSAAMTVDARKSRGTAAANDGATISIRASNNRGTSCAKVVLLSGSTEDYDNNEDAEMIADGNTGDIPQIYTVAGDRAVALNSLPTVGWLPLGILAEDDKEVETTFSGFSYSTSDMYLYDAQTSQFIPLENGTAVTMKANALGRYYLTSHKSVSIDGEQGDADVHIYRMVNGTVVVQSPVPGLLSSVDIYSLTGGIIASARLDGLLSWTWSVPSGIIVVKVTTSDGRVITRKYAR